MVLGSLEGSFKGSKGCLVGFRVGCFMLRVRGFSGLGFRISGFWFRMFRV